MKFIIASLMLITQVFAQDLMYPELNVVPRASTRIALETRDEAGSIWTYHLPVQLSSLATLAAGAMSGSSIDTEKDAEELSPKLAMGVGAAWMAVTTYAALAYRPYRAAYNQLKKMPSKTKRQKLLKERLAEEEIFNLRRLGKRIRIFSAVSNFAASAYLSGNMESSESDAAIAANFAALVSFTSLFFTYRWEDVADEQESYKKKIFAPVAMNPILRNGFNNDPASGVSLLWRF